MIAKLPLDIKKIDERRRLCRHLNVPSHQLSFFLSEENHPIKKITVPLIEECINYFKILSKEEFDSFINNLPSGIKFFLDNDSRISPINDDYYERISIQFIQLTLVTLINI